MAKTMLEELRWLAAEIASKGEARKGLIRIAGLGRPSMSRAVGLLTAGARAVSVKGTREGRYDVTLPGPPADHWLKLLGPYLARDPGAPERKASPPKRAPVRKPRP
jgi:hypothetical protein